MKEKGKKEKTPRVGFMPKIKFRPKFRYLILIVAVAAVVFIYNQWSGGNTDMARRAAEIKAMIMIGATPKPEPVFYPSEWEVAAENENLKLSYNKGTGELQVLYKKSGKIWYSNPPDAASDTVAKGSNADYLKSQIIVEYYTGWSTNTLSSVKDSLGKGSQITVPIENGIKVLYYFPDLVNSPKYPSREQEGRYGFFVPVEYTIKNDYFEARVLVQEIEDKILVEEVWGETEILTYNEMGISAITVLPYFGATSSDSGGYLFIPDGSGALVNFGSPKTIYANYDAPFYSNYPDTRMLTGKSNNVNMPVFGLKDGNDSFFAIASENEGVAFVTASIKGKDTSYNRISSRVYTRLVETLYDGYTSEYVPFSPEYITSGDYAVRYYFQSGDEAGYESWARIYQDYLVKEKGMTKRQQDIKPVYLDIFAGVQKTRSVFGVPVTVFDPITSYSQLVNMSKDLKTAGVNDQVINYSEWLNNSQRGKINTKVSFDGGLGGKSQFKKLLSYTKENNIQLYLNAEFVNIRTDGNGYSYLSDAARRALLDPFNIELKDVHGNVASLTSTTAKLYLGDSRYRKLNPALISEAVSSFLKSYKSYNNKYIALSSMGKELYSDAGEGGMMRPEVVKEFENVFQKVNSEGYEILLRTASAVAFPYASHIMDMPLNNRTNDLVDESIPFMQMVLHGYVQYGVLEINLSADPQKLFLQSLETGSFMGFSLIYSDPSTTKDTYLDFLYSSDSKVWIPRIGSYYEQAKPVYDAIAGKLMTGYEKVSENVTKTTYEGGVSVIVNYNDDSVTVGGVTVAGKSFALVK